MRGYVPVLLPALLAIAVYAISFSYDFTPMDERWVIQANKDLLSHFSNLPELFKAPLMNMYYRPGWMSLLMIGTAAGGGKAFGYHLVNVLLHAGCCILLFRLLEKIQAGRRFAFFASLIFAVHPLNLHAVAWVPGSNDTLLGFFTLASCICLLNYLQDKKQLQLAFHLLFFCLALFTKENAIVLPLVYAGILLLWGKTFSQQSRLALIASWLVLVSGWFLLRKSVVDFLPSGASGDTGAHLLNLLSALALYSGKIILPVQQSVMPVLKTTNLVPFFFATAAVIALSWKSGFRNRPLAFFGLAWFFAFLLIPAWVGATSSNGEHYEHRVYTSLAGAFIFFSQIRIRLPEKTMRYAAITVVLVFSVKTLWRMPVYKNEFSFLEAAVEESPSTAFFHNMIGNLYEERKDYEKAITSFSKAIELDTDRAEYYNNRGNAYAETKQYEKALADDNTVLRLRPDQPETWINRSMVHFYLQDYEAARRDLAQGQKLGATNISPAFIRELENEKRITRIKAYSEQIRQHPDDAQTLNARGVEWMQLGRFDYALDDFKRAIELAPGVPVLLANRDSALANLRRSPVPAGR